MEDFSFGVPHTPIPIGSSSMFKRPTVNDISVTSDGKESIGIIDLNELDEFEDLLDIPDDLDADKTISAGPQDEGLESRYFNAAPSTGDLSPLDPFKTLSETSIKFDVCQLPDGYSQHAQDTVTLLPSGHSDDEIDTDDELDAIRAISGRGHVSVGHTYSSVERGDSEGSAEDNVRPGLEGGSSEETDYPLYRRLVEGEQELPVPGDGGGGGDGSSDPESEDLVAFTKFTTYTDVTFPQPIRHRGNGHFQESEPRLRPLGNEETRAADHRDYSMANNTAYQVLNPFGTFTNVDSINFSVCDSLGERASDVLGFDVADGAMEDSYTNGSQFRMDGLGGDRQDMGRVQRGVVTGQQNLGRGQQDIGRDPNDITWGQHDMFRDQWDTSRGQQGCVTGKQNLTEGQHDMGRSQHDAGRSQHDAGRSQHDAGRSQHDAGRSQHDAGRSQHDAGRSQHDAGRSQHDAGRSHDMSRHSQDMLKDVDARWSQADVEALDVSAILNLEYMQSGDGGGIDRSGQKCGRQLQGGGHHYYDDGGCDDRVELSGSDVSVNADGDDNNNKGADYDETSLDENMNKPEEDNTAGKIGGSWSQDERLSDNVFLSPGQGDDVHLQHHPQHPPHPQETRHGAGVPVVGDVDDDAYVITDLAFNRSFMQEALEQQKEFETNFFDVSDLEFRDPDEINDELNEAAEELAEERRLLQTTLEADNAGPVDWSILYHQPVSQEAMHPVIEEEVDFMKMSIGSFMKRRSEALGSLKKDPDVPRPDFGMNIVSPPRDRTPLVLISPNTLKSIQQESTPESGECIVSPPEQIIVHHETAARTKPPRQNPESSIQPGVPHVASLHKTLPERKANKQAASDTGNNDHMAGINMDLEMNSVAGIENTLQQPEGKISPVRMLQTNSQSVRSNTLVTSSVRSNTSLTSTVRSNTSLTSSVRSKTSLTSTVRSNTSLTSTVRSNTSLTSTVRSNTSLTSTDLNYSRANELYKSNASTPNRPATPGGPENESSDYSVDITLNTIGRLVADSSLSAKPADLASKLLLLAGNKVKKPVDIKRKILKPSTENCAVTNNLDGGSIDKASRIENSINSSVDKAVDKSHDVHQSDAITGKNELNKENLVMKSAAPKQTENVEQNEEQLGFSMTGRKLSEQLARVSPIYKPSASEKRNDSGKFPSQVQRHSNQPVASNKVIDTQHHSNFMKKATDQKTNCNLNDLSVAKRDTKFQKEALVLPEWTQQTSDAFSTNISTLDDSNVFNEMNRDSMATKDSLAFYTPNLCGQEDVMPKSSLGSVFPYSFMCDSFKLMDKNDDVSYYCSTPSRPDSVVLPCPIKLHSQPPPRTCCVGVSTELQISLENTTSVWVECHVSAMDIIMNSAPLDPRERNPFITKPKITVGPNDSQVMSVLFVPKYPGTYSGKLCVECRAITNASQICAPTVPVILQTSAVNPNIQISPEPPSGLHYGQLGWGGWKSVDLSLTNTETFPVPLRLTLSQNNSTWESFCFGRPNDNDVSVISQAAHPAALHLTRNVTNVVLPPAGADTTTVTVYCKLPERQRSRQGVMVNKEELGAALHIELDTPTCVYHIASLPLTVVAGTHKLKVPSQHQLVTLSTSPGAMTYRKVTLKNEGNIDMLLSLKIADGEHEDLFSVYPMDVTIAPQAGTEVSIVFVPKTGAVPLYKSLCLMNIEPCGPVYEIPIVGKLAAAKPTNTASKAAVMCNKKELHFGTVPLGSTERMKVILRNISESPVLIKLKFSNDDGQLKIVKYPEVGECTEVVSQDILMDALSDLPITVGFTPTKVCSITSKLCVNVSGSDGGRYSVGLFGHGGESKLFIEGPNRNGDIFWVNLEDLTSVSCDIRCRKKFVIKNVGDREAYVKAICTPGTMRKVCVEPNQFVLLPTEVLTVCVSLQNLSSRVDTSDCLGRVSFYYSDELNLKDYNEKRGSKMAENDYKLDKTYTDIFTDLTRQVENILSLSVVVLELRTPSSRIKAESAGHTAEMVITKDQTALREPVRGVVPVSPGSLIQPVTQQHRVLDLPAPHPHRPSMDTDDVRIKNSIIVFAAVAPGNMTRYKVEVQNSGRIPHSIEVIQPSEPFFVRQTTITVKERRFLRLPVEFCPVKKGVYSGEVVLNVDNGSSLILKLSATCQ